jgi:tetratricopeptide (TPR) repeat protein
MTDISQCSNGCSRVATSSRRRFLAFAAALAIIGTVAGVQHATPAEEPKPDRLAPEAYRQFNAHAFYTLGQYLSSQKKDDEAIAAYTKAIDFDPKHAWAYYRRGNVYAERGDNARSLADFIKVTELDPVNIYGHFNAACFCSLEGKLPESLAALDSAMKAGYRKFDKIATDTDLEKVRARPEFAALIAKYKETKMELTPSQLFQTSPVEKKAEILAGAAALAPDEALRVAELAFRDMEVEIRVLSMGCFAALDTPQSVRFLVNGLYDNNGYVKKAAARQLITMGRRAEGLVVPILEGSNRDAVFYAVQILGGIGAKNSAAKIATLLEDEDSNTRMMAAAALGKLDAVDALPLIGKALERLEKTKNPNPIERIEFQRVKAHLEERAKKE